MRRESVEIDDKRKFCVKIDDKLTFTLHLRNTIEKATQKLHALSRVKCYTGFG